jgi:hypothetical protein
MPPAPLGSLALKLITQAGAGCSGVSSVPVSGRGISAVIERARERWGKSEANQLETGQKGRRPNL